MIRQKSFKDLTGQKFGRFTVISQAPHRYGRTHWYCHCECGNTVSVVTKSLTAGLSKSCGCLDRQMASERMRTHGKSNTPEYNSWRGMKERCYSPNHKHYAKYGGRGIKVCDSWCHDFSSFLADMGEKPSPQHSIDRSDNNMHYSCGHCTECITNGWSANCRWSNQSAQCQNRRGSISVLYENVEMPLVEVSRATGIPYGTLYQRYRLGKPLIPPATE